MVDKIDFKYTPKLLDEKLDEQLAKEGFSIFPCLEDNDIIGLINYYESFQKDKPNHFYATTHSQDIAFRKQTSAFIIKVIEPILKNKLVDFKLLGGAYVVKPGNGKGILQAHQDWNLVDETKQRSYNLWIPLIDVNEDNGALFVLPKSHAKILNYRGPQIPSMFKGIEQELWSYLTPLRMKAGYALLYDHALLHGSPPNKTTKDRLGIVVGIVKANTELQIYGSDNGIIKLYACDENYFLSKNTLTDFVEFPLKSILSGQQNELTFNEFKTLFLSAPSNTQQIMPEDQRTFFEKYTVKNILAELKYRLNAKTSPEPIKESQTNSSPIKKDVAQFYNAQTHNFLKVYGNVIQAFRTKDVSTLLDYQIQTMGLKATMKVLDAGCGVCGPAIYFSDKVGCTIEAISISSVQVNLAKEAIAKNNSKVNVREGNFHTLEKYYTENTFDVIYFLESFGHAHSHELVLDSAWKVLKPGGSIYIKDLFIKKAAHKNMALGIEKEIQNINSAYHYNVPDLNVVLDYVRKKGFILSALKTIDIPLEEFENLTISNDFQELTGINKIENLREYVFPVDFFELTLIKPGYDSNKGTSRYFLQNMYFLQTQNWKEKDL